MQIFLGGFDNRKTEFFSEVGENERNLEKTSKTKIKDFQGEGENFEKISGQ